MTGSPVGDEVRKHPAPEGALRQAETLAVAPQCQGRKHPAPEGALRPLGVEEGLGHGGESESTQHQKVH